jgi:hypothetical protein
MTFGVKGFQQQDQGGIKEFVVDAIVTALARVGSREGDFVKENEATKNANQLRPVGSEGIRP